MKKILSIFLMVLICLLPFASPVSADPRQPENRLLVLGNSISRSSPKPEIGWTGAWGMAASAEQQDYVHQLAAKIETEQGLPPEIKIIPMDIPWIATLPEAEAEMQVYSADLVIVQIGDNARDRSKAGFLEPYEQLLQAVYRTKAEAAPVYLVSLWGDDEKTNDYIKQLAVKYGAGYVYITDLGRDQRNYVWYEQRCSDPGVCWHPGDRGMGLISGRIFAAMMNNGYTVYLPVVHSRFQ